MHNAQVNNSSKQKETCCKQPPLRVGAQQRVEIHIIQINVIEISALVTLLTKGSLPEFPSSQQRIQPLQAEKLSPCPHLK